MNIFEGLITYDKRLEADLDKVAIALEFKPEQFITYSKHLPLGLYFLSQGEIKAVHYKTKESQIVKGPVTLEANAFFEQKLYQLTIQAKSTCQVFFLSKGIYEKLKRESHPMLKHAFFKKLV